jgi:hypothetical protein
MATPEEEVQDFLPFPDGEEFDEEGNALPYPSEIQA